MRAAARPVSAQKTCDGSSDLDTVSLAARRVTGISVLDSAKTDRGSSCCQNSCWGGGAGSRRRLRGNGSDESIIFDTVNRFTLQNGWRCFTTGRDPLLCGSTSTDILNFNAA